MKIIISLLLFFAFYSCKKNSAQVEKSALTENERIDSINVTRIKYNDSIKILNSKNRFRDLSGKHQLVHSSIGNTGSVTLKNIGRDLYEISGGAKSGKNYVKVEGELKMVSEEFLNFTGKITQSLAENESGKIEVRSKKTSFAKKGNAKYWRLQNMMNSSGFVDYIDIYF